MKISKEIRIALLGVAAIVAFVFGYNYLKGTGLFSSTKNVFVEYENVQGLTPASYVQLRGFTIGSVKNIELSKRDPSKVLVCLSIDKTLSIPVDTRAKIVSLDLLGTKAVALELGRSTEQVKDGQTISGMMENGMIESLGASAQPAIENAKNTIASLDQTIQSINTILDAETQQNLKSTIGNLNHTMKEFSQFATELNGQRQKISLLLDNLNSFAGNLNKNNTTITNVLHNAETTTANLSKLELQSTINELKDALEGMKATLNKMNNGTGSMALLMNDDKLYRNLKNTLATANNLLYDINARPSRYINVNVFGKKQKNECPPQQAPNSND